MEQSQLLVKFDGILFGGSYSSVFRKGNLESILKEKDSVRDLKDGEKLATQSGLFMYLERKGMEFEERFKVWALRNTGQATNVRVGGKEVTVVKATTKLYRFKELD